MDFSLSEEQTALQATAKRFAEAELVEIARKVEQNDQPPGPDLVRRFAELGFLGVNLDPDYGGQGAGHLEAVLVLEEIAKVSPAVAFPVFESCFGPVLAIQHFAAESLKRRVIPDVCRGEMMIAVSMSEPDAGSALTDLKTHAVISDDRIVINGQKRWCSGAGHADAYVVYCRMSDEPGAKGIGAVLVERGREGLTFGERERHMGFRGVTSADMFFDNVEVSTDNLIVGAGGFRRLMEAFDLERCGNTTMSLAIAQSAFDHVLGYVQERQQFGKSSTPSRPLRASLRPGITTCNFLHNTVGFHCKHFWQTHILTQPPPP